jgi:hypothetical protein
LYSMAAVMVRSSWRSSQIQPFDFNQFRSMYYIWHFVTNLCTVALLFPPRVQNNTLSLGHLRPKALAISRSSGGPRTRYMFSLAGNLTERMWCNETAVKIGAIGLMQMDRLQVVHYSKAQRNIKIKVIKVKHLSINSSISASF